MTNNYQHLGVGGYISDRYGRPKPRVTLDVAIEDQITLADIRHLVAKAENFTDDAKIIVFKDVIRVVQEPTKPATMHHRGGGHLQWTIGPEKVKKNLPPRDNKGRFVKRD